MEIRPIDKKDLIDCARIFIHVYNEEPFNDSWEVEQAALRIKDLSETPHFFGMVAEEDEVVVGFVMGYSEQWFPDRQFCLKEMCVRKDMQRRGIGTALIEGLLEEMIKFNASVLYVNTGRKTGAARFFRQCSFLENESMVQFFTRARV
ncbi:MAG: N-acetyltransferase family protein [Candidatus Sumerlaeia bacterium]